MSLSPVEDDPGYLPGSAPTGPQHDVSTQESPHAEAVHPEAVRALRLRFPSWHPWYGRATGHWWALAPVWCRQHLGLIEADTLTELAAQLQQIEECRSHLTPAPSGVLIRPRPRTTPPADGGNRP
ncbi:hypothetical protein [Streptosporangium sp. NPDC087985]|uniref:hypothetical protein n=1 Tax=Streptosporangium sp. NPDC087985 TaxID=3366196 RepID=UPI00381B96A4